MTSLDAYIYEIETRAGPDGPVGTEMQPHPAEESEDQQQSAAEGHETGDMPDIAQKQAVPMNMQ
jgi:hypothetical protein